MVQYRRSNSTLPTTTQSRVRAAGPTPHAIPNFRGEMDGINPMAGDMTAAFSKFFGSLNQSAQSVIDTNRQIEVNTTKDIRRQAAIEAELAAHRNFQNPANKGLTDKERLDAKPAQFIYKGETINSSEYATYSQTYANVIGKQTGRQAYNDVINEADKQNITPENMEGFMDNFWTTRFGEGTGNPEHDVAAQKVWSDATDEVRFNARKSVNERAQARLMLRTSDEVSSMARDNNFSLTEWHEAKALYAKADGGTLTQGQISSKVLGDWLSVAKTTETGARNLSNFIHAEQIDANGENYSLYTRFPREMQPHLASLYDAQKKYVTINGAAAGVKVSSALADATALPDNTGSQLVAKAKALVDIRAKIKSLRDIPGTGQAATRLNSEWTKVYNKNRTNHLEMLEVARAAQEGRRSTLTGESLKAAERRFASIFDILKNPDHSQKAAGLGANMHNAGGDIPTPWVDAAKQGLRSSDKAVVMNAVKFLRGVDPENNWFAGKYLSDDAAAAVMYSAYTAPGFNFNDFDRTNHESYRSALDMLTNEKGLYARIVLGADAVSGDNKLAVGDYAAAIDEIILGEENGGTLGERLKGERDWGMPWQTAPRVSPTVAKYAKQLMPHIIARHMAMTGETASEIDMSKMLDKLTAAMKPMVIPTGDYFQINKPDAQPDPETFEADGDPLIRRPPVPLSTAVMNPSGVVENTAQNMTDAVKRVETGVLGLMRKDGGAVSLVARTVDVLRGKNGIPKGMMIYDENSSSPLAFQVGEDMDVQRLFSNEGEPYSWYSYLNPWGEAGENKVVKFTGNEAEDRATARQFLDPSLSLIAIRPGGKGTEIIGYNVAVRPHWKNLSDNMLSEADIAEMAKRRNLGVKERRPTLFQKKLLDPDVRESTKILSMGGVY